MFQSRYMPCTQCGASVERTAHETHVCDSERRLSYQLFQLRGEVERFEAEFSAFLGSALGKFEAWCARRERTGGG